MIKMQLIGNLGRDAEIQMHGSEVVVNFSVAHTDKYKDAHGSIVQKTTWVSCSWWTDRQNIVQYLKKGQMVYVEGIPEAKPWKDKANGEAKAFLNMRVGNLQLVGGGRSNTSTQSSPSQGTVAKDGYVPAIEDDEVPF